MEFPTMLDLALSRAACSSSACSYAAVILPCTSHLRSSMRTPPGQRNSLQDALRRRRLPSSGKRTMVAASSCSGLKILSSTGLAILGRPCLSSRSSLLGDGDAGRFRFVLTPTVDWTLGSARERAAADRVRICLVLRPPRQPAILCGQTVWETTQGHKATRGRGPRCAKRKWRREGTGTLAQVERAKVTEG